MINLTVKAINITLPTNPSPWEPLPGIIAPEPLPGYADIKPEPLPGLVDTTPIEY